MEFKITFAIVRPNKQTGTMVMRQRPLMARMKLPFIMAALGLNSCPEVRVENTYL